MAIAILSADIQANIDRFVQHYGLEAWVQLTRGADQFPAKPDPQAYRLVCEQLGVLPEQTLMVGDGPTDLAMARGRGRGRRSASPGAGRGWGDRGADRSAGTMGSNCAGLSGLIYLPIYLSGLYLPGFGHLAGPRYLICHQNKIRLQSPVHSSLRQRRGPVKPS
ncbi:MAG: HAD family hydrolase [Synechococcales cyanobacterium RM1_1_8]|nr:HAD family hydrolase [Synechococcales cyanobacterium RM1_1_8]